MNSPTILRTSTADLYDAHVLKNYARAPLTLVRGRGSFVWDDQGKQYLDFTSGIAVSALGHCHPHWVVAIQRQAAELIHTSNLFRNPNQAELARRLVGYAGPGRVFFCNSGAEANEALIKLARLHGEAKAGGVEGKCYKIICAKNAFHGRTFGGMSATPQEKIQKGFRPLVPGFEFGELNNLQSFADLVDDQTAAIFIETIQGESGINPCTPEFLRGLRELCTKNNLLLLVDEVQCGIGRTGKFYAFEYAGVQPDAIGMAKGLGGGFPIGAMWVRENAAELFHPGNHGTTFGGTPLACAVALKILDVIEAEQLADQARKTGAWMKSEIEQLAKLYPTVVKSVRGLGLMLGFELAETIPAFAAGDKPAAIQFTNRLHAAGVLAIPAGTQTIRLLPALNLKPQEAAEGIAKIAALVKSLA